MSFVSNLSNAFQRIGRPTLLTAVAAAAVATSASPAVALNPVYTETFSTGDANWGTGQTPSGTRFAPTYNASGGPAGVGDGYISYLKPFTTSSTVTIFRNQSAFNSSGGAFFGDWAGANVSELSFFVKHDNPNPVSFFARIATAGNFPAFSIPASADVPPNVWTKVTLPTTFADYTAPGSQWTFESFDDPAPPAEQNYQTVFGNVQAVQLLAGPEGATVPASFTFSLDNVSIVPEPAALGLLACVAAPALLRRRRVAK